jgi:hypothetical protein
MHALDKTVQLNFVIYTRKMFMKSTPARALAESTAPLLTHREKLNSKLASLNCSRRFLECTIGSVLENLEF